MNVDKRFGGERRETDETNRRADGLIAIECKEDQRRWMLSLYASQ